MNAGPIEWTDDLLTGDETIDTQHKAFFLKALRVFVACKLGRGTTEITSALTFMRQYAASHFKDEEARMEVIDYPHIQTHREAHQAFRLQLEQLEEQFTESKDKPAVARKISRIATEWFAKHINLVDRPLIERLKGAL